MVYSLKSILSNAEASKEIREFMNLRNKDFENPIIKNSALTEGGETDASGARDDFVSARSTVDNLVESWRESGSVFYEICQSCCVRNGEAEKGIKTTRDRGGELAGWRRKRERTPTTRGTRSSGAELWKKTAEERDTHLDRPGNGKKKAEGKPCGKRVDERTCGLLCVATLCLFRAVG